MAPVVHGYAGPDAHANLGEVQADAIRAAETVVWNPDHLRDIHPAAPGVVADEPPERVVDQARDPTGPEPEPSQRIGDVVLAAARISFKNRRQLDALMSGRAEPNHAFSEGQDIVFRLFTWRYRQRHVS